MEKKVTNSPLCADTQFSADGFGRIARQSDGACIRRSGEVCQCFRRRGEFHNADSWIRRESAARAVGRGNVKFHQKSMDPRRENWRLSSMGWSEVMREVWLDDLIGRPCGGGGRFRRPWLGEVGCSWRSSFFLSKKTSRGRYRSLKTESD